MAVNNLLCLRLFTAKYSILVFPYYGLKTFLIPYSMKYCKHFTSFLSIEMLINFIKKFESRNRFVQIPNLVTPWAQFE